MLSKDTFTAGPLASSRRYRLCYEHTRTTFLILALFTVSLGSFFQAKKHFLSFRPDVPSGAPTSSTSADIADDRLNTTEHALRASLTNKFPLKISESVLMGASELVDLPFFDSGSMTAILPVTRISVERIQQIVEPLISEQSSVSAITLICPSEILPVINAVFRGGHMDTFLDISVVIWAEGFDEGATVLGAAAQTVTEYTLIMGSEGLGDLDEDSRDQLLSHPLLMDLPTGFCGGRFTKVQSHTICVSPLPETQSASFLVPPFVLSSSLTRGFNASMGHNPNFWSEFGRTLIHQDGIGVVVQETEKSTDKVWCQAQCQRFGLVVDGTAPECSTVTDADAPEDQTTHSASSSSLAIILPALSDLESFSHAVCGLIRNGYDAHVLILSHNLDHDTSRDGSFPWLHDQLISNVCEISYSALHSSSNDYANAEAVRFWLKSANELMSVIIYGTDDTMHASTTALEIELERQSGLGTTIIKIPQDDLLYCDWIGSLSLTELRSWHFPSVELTVITNDRPNSLLRLFKSLKSAHYFGDSINIRINQEQTADLETQRLVDTFTWQHGHVFVHHRVVHAGLLIAIVESWYPRTNDSYAIILEDDVEVSPMFYAWSKMALLHYRYGHLENKIPSLFGISLYQQKQIELRPEGRRPFDARSLFDAYGVLYRNTPYLSQIPCSWGAVYFPEHWREFHSYLMVRFSEAWLPLREHVVPHVRSNRWAKSWKRFFIELVFLRGYVMLYPNYDDFVSLSTNHLEIGSHVKEQPRSIYDQKKALFTLPLLTLPDPVGSRSALATGLLDLPEDQMPAWSELPVLDLLGHLSSNQELEQCGMKRQKELIGCTTIGSRAERHRSFEAEELFTCGSENDGDEADDDFDNMDVHYDI